MEASCVPFGPFACVACVAVGALGLCSPRMRPLLRGVRSLRTLRSDRQQGRVMLMRPSLALRGMNTRDRRAPVPGAAEHAAARTRAIDPTAVA
jgi:hypothetical protein